MFLSLGKAGWYWITKGNIFFCVMDPFFKWPFSTGADNSRHVFLQNFVRFPLSPSLVVFLSSVRFLLSVERVRFVFRMGNASPYANHFFTPRKMCLRAGTIPARRWVILTNFSTVARMSTKKREVVDKDLLRCYIKFIPRILKVLLTKPYKRLWKKKLNQILVVRFIPKLLF